MKLNEEQIIGNLADSPDWTRKDEKWLTRKYRFPKFMGAIDFVNQVAQISEEHNHHPFISIDYKMVTLTITSWNAGGLTDLDFKIIKVFDSAFDTLKSAN